MPSLLPREWIDATSVIRAPIQRPSPSVHRVGFSSSLTRLVIGSLALRPALLLFGNSRPRITTTPLPHVTGAYGQRPGRDFNPLDLLLLLPTVRSWLSTSRGSAATRQPGPMTATLCIVEELRRVLASLVYRHGLALVEVDDYCESNQGSVRAPCWALDAMKKEREGRAAQGGGGDYAALLGHLQPARAWVGLGLKVGG
jgi:hypothetical protein